MDQARSAAPVVPADAGMVADLLRQVSTVIRQRLRELDAAAWRPPRTSPEAMRLITRLNMLAAAAARQRDRRLLQLVERGLTFAGSAHTAGEAMLVGRLAGMAEGDLVAALPGLPRPPATPEPWRPRLTGLVVGLG